MNLNVYLLSLHSRAYSMSRLSGIQKSVLGLYREALRAGAALPATSSPAALAYIRQEFRAGQGIDRMDFQRIEHLIRSAKKKIAMMAQSEAFSLSPQSSQR